MTRDDQAHLALAVSLIALAGFVDAIGFLRLGHLFVSFMSGDSTRLAIAATRLDWTSQNPLAAVVGLFFAGVVAGRLLWRMGGSVRRALVLVAEAGLLALAASTAGGKLAAVVPLSLAMGVQNAAVHRASGAKIGLTYVTGTLVALGEAVGDVIGSGGRERPSAWAPYLLLWLGMVCGAALGALAYDALRMNALFLATAAALALAVGAAVSPALRVRTKP